MTHLQGYALPLPTVQKQHNLLARPMALCESDKTALNALGGRSHTKRSDGMLLSSCYFHPYKRGSLANEQIFQSAENARGRPASCKGALSPASSPCKGLKP